MHTNKIAGSGKFLRSCIPLLTLSMLIAVGACASDSVGPDAQQGHIQILLTDAPTDMLDSAHVWISRIYLVGGGGSVPDTIDSESDGPGAGKIDLFNDPQAPLLFDLLQLQDGVTADLTGLIGVDPTSYRGLRFVVDSSRVTLREDLTFEDGTRQAVLRIPSGSTSGIKVKINDVFDIGADETLVVTVDFDVDANFVIQTNNQTGEVRSVRFTPVLREKGRRVN